MVQVITLGEGRRAKNAWLWQDGQALSDTLIRVLHLPSAKGETAEQLEAKQQKAMHKEEYRLHSVVLAASSDYFKIKLLQRPPGSSDGRSDQATRQLSSGSNASHSNAGGQQSEGEDENTVLAPDDTQIKYLIEERLAPSDVSAARAVLRHMYTEQLTCDSPAQLVSVLKIADKWQAHDCIEACRAAFSRLKPEDLDLDVIKQVYSLEGILRDVQNFAELVNTVQSRLVTMFQDIVEVVQNISSRNMFLQLPFAAVVALLRSPQLIIDSEDTVVVAANLWIMTGKGRSTTQEQRRFLAGVINLSGLSPAYMCGVLPNLRWFTPLGAPFTSWTQALPAPYFAELQQRLVSPKAKQVLCSNNTPTVAGQMQTTAVAVESTPIANNSRASPSSSQLAPNAKVARHPAVSPGRPGILDSPASASQGANSRTGASERPLSQMGSPDRAGPASGTIQLPAPEVPTANRVIRDQNLEIECDIDFARLKQYLEDGHSGLMGAQEGFRGIHVHSQCSYFKGFMWGIKLVFGFSAGHNADGTPAAFTVTPSPFASLPPGEEGIRPLTTPINVSFRCTMEAVAGDKAAAYANATYQGASFLRPGEEHVSSIGIANFFKRVPNQYLPESWLPFLVDGKLRLRLRVVGNSVE